MIMTMIMIVFKQHKEKSMEAVMIQIMYIGQRGSEIGPKLSPNSYDFHIKSRSTKGYYSHAQFAHMWLH